MNLDMQPHDVIQCLILIENRQDALREAISAIHRKRSWRPSEKAMAIADWRRDIEQWQKLRIALRNTFDSIPAYGGKPS